MTFDEIENLALSITEKGEEKVIKDIMNIYALTYKQSKALISEFVLANSTNGKLDPNKANKYNRVKKLNDDLLIGIKFAENQTNTIIDKHLNEVYKTNYNYTAYAIEGITDKRIITKKLQNVGIKDIIQTPLDKLAIQDNSKMVKANIQRDITTAVQQQMQVTELADMVKKSLQTNQNNAIRIAQTEQTRAVNLSRFTVAEKAKEKGVEIFKVWDARLDRKTRKSHARLDGDAIPLNRKFDNGLMYPGDQSGPASEVVNCRCALRFITGDGQLAEDFKSYEEWLKNLS